MLSSNQPEISQQAGGQNLVQHNFGAAAQAYVTSAVHANGKDLAWIVEAAALTGQETVVDIATGTGHTALVLAPYAHEVIAVDITVPMLQAAQQLAVERRVSNIRFLEADTLALPLDDNSCDLVTCRYAAHHFAAVEQAVQEWERILKTGGKVIISDTIAPEEPDLDVFLNEIELLRDPSHIRNYRVSEWLSLLNEAGFAAQVVHAWDLTMDVPSWTQRMRTPPEAIEQIEQRFHNASPTAQQRFHIGIGEEGLLSFANPCALFVGIKK